MLYMQLNPSCSYTGGSGPFQSCGTLQNAVARSGGAGDGSRPLHSARVLRSLPHQTRRCNTRKNRGGLRVGGPWTLTVVEV